MIQSIRSLIIAAHPDDETIGMGGVIRRLASMGTQVSVLFISDGVSSRELERESVETRRTAARAALEILGCSNIEFGNFKDNTLDSVSEIDVTRFIEENIKISNPDTIFTHFRNDLNIDHQITSKCSVVAARPKYRSGINALYHFEVVSSTGWNFGLPAFNPNVFIDISDTYEAKLCALQEYSTEMNNFPNARSIESLEALAKYRGSTVGMGKAEAFETGFVRYGILN
jgi:LmbE family N-acetylglucosaminyl deacetylase